VKTDSSIFNEKCTIKASSQCTRLSSKKSSEKGGAFCMQHKNDVRFNLGWVNKKERDLHEKINEVY
jgi:hypothetical protein